MTRNLLAALVPSAAACLLLSACGSTAPARTEIAATPDTGELALQPLPPFEIDPKTCTMVLLTRDTSGTRVMAAFDAPAVGRIRVHGTTLNLPRAEVSGAVRAGQSERQVYRGEDGSVLISDVRFEDAGDPASGAMIRSGTVAYTAPNGETVITPVVGIATCGAAP
ncbi:MAG: hypothetical protein R3C52_00055 [Hyphomonadaceae bacterium]